MIPRPLTFAITGPLAGWSAARISARSTTVVGKLSLRLSLVVFALVAEVPGTAVIGLAPALSGPGSEPRRPV